MSRPRTEAAPQWSGLAAVPARLSARYRSATGRDRAGALDDRLRRLEEAVAETRTVDHGLGRELAELERLVTGIAGHAGLVDRGDRGDEPGTDPGADAGKDR